VTKLRVAHVVMPRADPERPALEFVWAATRALRRDPRLEVRTIVPVPVAWARRIQNAVRRARGARGWPLDLDERMTRRAPCPELVPFLPRPSASLDAAASAVVRRLGRWPHRILGSILDEGGYVAARAGHQLATPAVAVAHGTDVRTAARQSGAAPGGSSPAARSRWTAQHARVVAVSESLADEITAFAPRPPVVPFTVFADDFPLVEVVPSNPPVRLLFVGRCSREKGLDRLLTALSRMPPALDWRLELVGPEVPGFDVREQLRSSGLTERVQLRGNRPQAELPARYAASHALALPTRAEALGNVLVESLLVGRPVIAAAVGGVPEVVGPGAGRLVFGEGADPWAAALGEFLPEVAAGRFEPAALRSMGEAWTWERHGPRLADIVADDFY